MKPKLISCLAGAALALLSGCSLWPESKPVQILDPSPATAEAFPSAAPWSLDLARPETDPVRDSSRVLVRTSDGRLNNYSSVRWVAPTPDMLRRLMVRHWRDRGLSAEIRSAGSGGDRLLSIDLRRFELEESDPDLTAVIEIEARLHDSPSYEVTARTRLSQRKILDGRGPAAVNAAFESALEALLTESANWLRNSALRDARLESD